jgi:CubicO group peptidase (beta-lactamase class C family)
VTRIRPLHRPLGIGSFVSTVLVVGTALVLAAAAPSSKPEDVGLSADRLQRIGQLIDRYIEDKQITGAVTLVSRRGRTAHFEARGMMDADARTAMRRDGVFRIASMTKPVTGVAILMLMEEGRLRLTDPVSRFIPEFKDPKVAMLKQAPPGPGQARPAPAAAADREPEIYTVPAMREITIRDLLTHTSGLQSGGAGSREAARIAPRHATDTLAVHIPKLGAAPLDFQPGTAWRYSGLAGIDVLGRIVEVASGMTFDRFLKERIFDPLGMKDTAFGPTPAAAPRVVTLYRKASNGLERQETPAWLATSTLFSGGGGLWSTADDYAQFAQMLVNGGEVIGKRLLSPRTIDLMAANHVGSLYAEASPNGARRGMGFGLTVEVVLDPVAASRRISEGSFGWDGAFGTHFWVDRREQLAGLMLIQQAVNPELNRDFENAVMQAVVD